MGGLYPTISQITYWGVGDIDECSILATFWAARAAGFEGTLPSIKEFRFLAGRPDKPGPTGLVNLQVWQGFQRTSLSGGGVNATMVRASTSWTSFAASLRMGGAASIAVDSSKLPTSMRYGFYGAHRVGLTWYEGKWYLANPLAPDKSLPQVISEAAIRAATLAFGGGSVSGIIFTNATSKTAGSATPSAAAPVKEPPLLADSPALAGLIAFVTPHIDARKIAAFYRAKHVTMTRP